MDKKEQLKALSAGEDRRLCIPYINQSTVSEAGEEFTLPDYYPEVRRVVSTLCRVLPEPWYDNGDAVEQGGVVAFTVLYLGDDGSLAAAPLTTDFSAVLQTPGKEDEGAVMSVDTVAENVTCRATGPRRLVLKARLRTTVSGERGINADSAVTDSGGDNATVAEKLSVQTLERTVPALRRATGRTTGSASGEFHERAGTKPVMCDGEIIINETSVTDTGVTVRGDALMWCICFGADGLYYKATAKAPFEENIAVEGADFSGGDARAWGRCASVSVKDSEDGSMTWNMEYDLECEKALNSDVTVAADMYSTMWESKTVPGKCESLSMLRCIGGRLTLSGAMKHSARGGDYVIGSFGCAKGDRLEMDGRRLVLNGNADIKVLICGGGEVSEENLRIPFKYETDCNCSGNGELVWRCDVSVIDSAARLEGDTVNISCELYISLYAGERREVEYVSKLELDRSSTGSDAGGCVRIYYPSADETAWDIAKKYRIDAASIGDPSPDGVIIG